MSDLPRPEVERTISEHAQSEIQQIQGASFSPPAFSVLQRKIFEYISDLIKESFKISRRHVSDTVSMTDVERASEYLASSTSRRVFRLMGIIGGALLGAALSNISCMT